MICIIIDDGLSIIASYTVTASGTIQLPFFTGSASSITVRISKTVSTGCDFAIDNLYLYYVDVQSQIVCDSVAPAFNDYRYGFNGKEKDNETYGINNAYDFGDRMYDPRLGRMLSMDDKANKYSFISPYSFAIDNPINATDPNGKDVYLIIWATANGEIGHAAIAVSNYRQVITKTIVNGQEITSTTQVPDGTFTYYDLWPGGSGAGKDNATVDIDGKYYKTSDLTWNGMFNKDPSGGEGRQPDGIIKLGTDYETDMNVIQTMENRKADDKPYNGATNNCSDNAECGVEAAVGHNINADEVISTEVGAATTPNQLFKATKKLPNATVLRDPGSKVDNGFISGAVGYGPIGRKIQESRNPPVALPEDNVKQDKQQPQQR